MLVQNELFIEEYEVKNIYVKWVFYLFNLRYLIIWCCDKFVIEIWFSVGFY